MILPGMANDELSVKPNSQRPPETLGNRWSTTTDQKVRGSNPFKRTSAFYSELTTNSWQEIFAVFYEDSNQNN